MIEIKDNWFAQGIIVNLFWLVPTLLFNVFKVFLLSINAMTRYITVYIALLFAVCFDIIWLSYASNWELSLPLLKKPLIIGLVCALIYLFIIVRKNRIDKNKFIKNSHNLIELELLEKNKLLRDKLSEVIIPKTADDMLFEVMKIYLNEIPMRFKMIFDILLRTTTTNKLVITSKLFQKRMYEEFKISFNPLEKSLRIMMDTIYIENVIQTKTLVDLNLEMHRLQAKYKTEVSLLFNDKIFIHNHIP